MTQSRPVSAPAPDQAPDSAPHVVHVIGALDRGGAETLSLDVCQAIPATEVRQTFITLGGREGSLAAQFRAAGAVVQQCPRTPAYSFPLRLWRCLRSMRAQVVVSHVSLLSAVVLTVARFLGVPVRIARMWSEADGRPDTAPRVALRSVLRRLLGIVATDVVGISAGALAFAGLPAGSPRGRLIYNGVNPARLGDWDRASARRRWGLPDDVPIIGYIGRAAPEKNRPFLVDVHRAVRQTAPTTRLLVVGPRGVDDLVAAHPDVLHDASVVLGGEAEEVASVLAAVDVLLLPSRWEGVPGVVLEALAAGVPVVATDLPGLREVSRHLTGLTLLHLAEGPQRWAAAASQSMRAGPAERDEIRSSFSASPFQLEQAVRQWRSLWRVATG